MIPISDSENKPKRFPFINLALIFANIYVFYLQLTTPDLNAFIYQYALVPANIDFANPATLYPFVTSMFLHGGLLHIVSNMLFLWVFGDNVEGELPPFFYLILYLGSGIIGGLAQYFLAPDSTIPMLGASGAVAGTLGAYFFMFPKHSIRTIILLPFFFTVTRISAMFMLGYWIVLQLIAGSTMLGQTTAQEGGVAYFAHIGGFLAGILFALLLGGKRRPEVQKVYGTE